MVALLLAASATVVPAAHAAEPGTCMVRNLTRGVIEGDGSTGRTLLVLAGAHLVLDHLTFTNDSFANAIFNQGSLRLRHVAVIDNVTFLAAVENEGSLRIARSRVSRNTPDRDGGDGGIVNLADGSLVVRASRVIGNVAPRGRPAGGITNEEGGTAQVIDSVVRRNRPQNCFGVVCP